MKKRMLTILMTICLLVCLLPTGALAADPQIGATSEGIWGGVRWTFVVTEEGGYGTLTIAPLAEDETPETWGKTKQPYPRGAWREPVSYDRNGNEIAVTATPYDEGKVRTLVIEEGVTSIGSFAAQNMTAATGALVIPSTVTYIGQETFYKAAFTSVVFTPSAADTDGTANLCVAHGAFKYMPNIGEISFPNRLKCLHAWQFSGCVSLESINIPNCTYMQGTNHLDYELNANTQANPSWVNTSGIVDGLHDDSLKSISFGSSEVRDMFFAGGRNGNSADSIAAFTGLTAYIDLQDAIDAAENSSDKSLSLVQKVTVSAGETLVIPKGITLDLNGKTLANNGTVINNGSIGNGTITNGNSATLANTGTMVGVSGSQNAIPAIYFDINGGNEEIAPIFAAAGEDIFEAMAQITAPTRTGYTFGGWNPSVPNEMPESGLLVTANWNKIIPRYTITASTENLTVKSSARHGETVTVTVKEGMEIDGLKATDRFGNPVEITRNGEDYTFVMPYGGIDLVELTNSFEDVSKEDYFFDAVLWADDAEISTGTAEGVFSPDSLCTRGQMALLLWRAAGCPEPGSSTSPFTDVDIDDIYGKAVLWAVEEGITSGTTATTFDPNAACGRAQAVAFLCRMVDGKAGGSAINFADVDANAYYAEYVQWAAATGITVGTSENTFSPDAACTRAQAVTFIWRCMTA